MTKERVGLINSTGIVPLLVATLFIATPGEVLAKPKASRPGMHTCTVGELETVEARDRAWLDACNIDGGTMYCDNTGYECCRTSQNGVDVCSGQNWDGSRPRPQGSLTPTPRNFRPTPGTSGGILRRGVEGEQPDTGMANPSSPSPESK